MVKEEINLDSNLSEPIAEPASKQTEKAAKDRSQLQLSISKKRAIIWLVVLLIAGLGLSTWYLKWYQPLWDLYNTTSISIKVKAGDELNLEGAKILLNNQEYQTDQNGQVNVEKIVAGQYEMTVKKVGYLDVVQRLTIQRSGNDLVMVALERTPEKVYSLKGYVFDLVSGAPITDSLVTLSGSTVRTNPAGEYSFTSQLNGEYKLVFSKSGYINKELSLTVKDADVVTAQVNLTPTGNVVFVSNRDSGSRALYSSNYDGTDQHQLVKPVTGSEDFGSVLSPDGNWVVFSSTRDGVTSEYGSKLSRLYLVGTNGQNLKKVSDDYSHYIVKWSPNSQYLYFEGYSDTKISTMVRRFYKLADGSLTDLGESGQNVTFSTAGTAVLYSLSVEVPVVSSEVSPSSVTTITREVALKKFELGSGARTTLVQKSASYYQNLSWSTDDKTVYYESRTETGVQRFSITLATGIEQAEIYNPDLLVRNFVTAPDGKSKVFIEERDGKRDLYLVDSNGQNEKRLTTLGVLSAWLAPRYDSSVKYLIFAVTRQGENAWYIVGKDGGEAKKVVDFTTGDTGPSYYSQGMY